MALVDVEVFLLGNVRIVCGPLFDIGAYFDPRGGQFLADVGQVSGEVFDGVAKRVGRLGLS